MEINPENPNKYHNKQQFKTRLHIIPFLNPVFHLTIEIPGPEFKEVFIYFGFSLRSFVVYDIVRKNQNDMRYKLYYIIDI